MKSVKFKKVKMENSVRVEFLIGGLIYHVATLEYVSESVVRAIVEGYACVDKVYLDGVEYECV